MDLREEWVDYCLRLSAKKGDFYSGCRKIIRNRTLTFNSFDGSLVMADAGYKKQKTAALTRAYLHAESRDMAVDLWKIRRAQAKYGSVGFSCYNHLIKGHGHNAYWNRINEKKTGKVTRASVMGPCIQAVTLTWLKKDQVAIDVFYRTTEILKKFPADLAFLRDVLLAPFDFDGMEIVEVNCHFANITVHPMYFVTILPHIENPTEVLDKIKKADKYFFDWIVKWSARYVCDEYHRGIQKFGQAMRVRKDVLERLTKEQLAEVQQYFRDNHPGYRGQYVDPDSGEDDEDEEG